MNRWLSATIWALQGGVLGAALWNLRHTAPGREWFEHPWSYLAFTLVCAFFIGSELGRAFARFTRGGTAQRLMLSLLCTALLSWANALGYQRIVVDPQAEVGVPLGALWIGLLALWVLLGVGFGRRGARAERRAVA
jgi:Na+/glutamate symporter